MQGRARHGPFDLVIAADGTNSALRGRLMPGARAPLYPWGCFWATVPDLAGIGAGGVLRQRVRGTTIMMGLLPVGQGQVTLFWSLPLKALGTEPADRPCGLAQGRHGGVAEAAIVERAAESEITRASYRHVNLPRWNAGPVLFIGDAAHGTSPQLGQGANLGLVDAMRSAWLSPRAPICCRPSCCSSDAAMRPCATTGRPATC